MGDDSAASPAAKIDLQSMSFAGLASRSLQEAYGQEITSVNPCTLIIIIRYDS